MSHVSDNWDATRRQVIQGITGVLTAVGLSRRGAAQQADERTIYIGSGSFGDSAFPKQDGTLYAVDAATGNRLWIFTQPSSGVRSPTVTNGIVYVGSFDGILYAVDAATGDQQWAFETGGTLSGPTVVDDTVYVQSSHNYNDANSLYAVTADSGDQKWEYQFTPHDGISSPTVVDDVVYLRGVTTLHAVDVDSGKTEWSTQLPPGIGSPTVVGSTVYVGSGASNNSADAMLHAINADSGREEWTFTQSGAVSLSPAVANDMVYTVAGGDGASATLYAVSAESGEQEWEFTELAGMASWPTVADGTVYVGSDGATVDEYEYGAILHAVDVDSGEQRWASAQPFDYRRISTPTVVGDTVYVGARGQGLYTLDVATGSEKWKVNSLDQAGDWSSPTVVEDPESGSSVGSRVMLGTMGHHGEWEYAGQDIDIVSENTETTGSGNSFDGAILGTTEMVAAGGGGSLALLLGAYALMRRSSNKDTQTDRSHTDSTESVDPRSDPKASATPQSSMEPSSESPDTSTVGTDMLTTSTEQSKDDDSSVTEELRFEAEEALNAAVTASKAAQFDEAADAYRAALTQYQSALDELGPKDTETRAEIKESIESAREKLEMVTTRRDCREDITETLSTAERSFQVGIVAYAQASETLARIRFRQARSGFDNAVDLLKNSDNDLLTPPVEVNVQPDRKLASAKLDELPMIPETATMALADTGVDTLGELRAVEEPPWTPAAVETLVTEEMITERVETTLTLLSWWNDTDSYEFDTITAVSQRREQADYGHTQSL